MIPVPNDDSDQDAAIAAMEACLFDIRSWMINEKLMINDSKAEFMLIGTKAQLQKSKCATLTIGESIISPSTEPFKNLGAWFDCHFNLASVPGKPISANPGLNPHNPGLRFILPLVSVP